MSRAALAPTHPPEPFGMMRRLSDEMDRLFQGAGLPRPLGVWRDDPWNPAVEAFVRDGHYVVRAELPGLAEKDVTVEIRGDVLTLKGERKAESDVSRDGYFASERHYGAFLRALTLPEGAVGDGATALFKNGVLEVAVPMATVTPPPAVRKVEVKPG